MHSRSPPSVQLSGNEQSGGLEDNERVILDRQQHGVQNIIGETKQKLWRYASGWSRIVIVLSSFSGLIAGAANPFLVVSFSLGFLPDTLPSQT